MPRYSGIVEEVRKISWCVSLKLKVEDSFIIVKLEINNYNIQPGDTIEWYKDEPYRFYWISKTNHVTAELYQWGQNPSLRDED
jgi:hypothetical protein